MGKNKKGKKYDFLTYLLMIGFLFVLRNLPKKFSRSFCLRLGRLAYKLDKKHRELTIDNLEKAFPEKSDDEIAALSLEVFEGVGLTLFDYARLLSFNKSNFHKHFEYEGTEYVKEAKDGKKGILLLSAHICCWELLCAHTFVLGETSVIAKDIHNEYVNRYVKKIRKRLDISFIPARDSIRDVMKLLKSGGMVLSALDQHMLEQDAVTVDFFGRRASTGYFAALLALKLDISVIPVFVSRVGRYKYRLTYQKPCDIISTGDRKKDIIANTQAFTAVIEDEIRKRPRDWLWLHNRWKQ